jgi:hypothetical protein
MTKARTLADLLDANGDVKTASLDNVPASNDASALNTGTLNNARLPNNIIDGGTEGTRIAQGTTAQRGSTEGQLRYNTTTDSLEIRNNSEFVAIEKAISISSVAPLGITPSENTGGGNNITLTGTGFVSGATVKFIGNDGTEFNASSVSFTNSTTVVAVAPELTASKEPFDVKITNPSGNTAQIDNQIQINNSPVWQTASGTLATINDNATGTHATISATDADGESVTYSESTSILSGAGLSLGSSNGQITGDPTNVNTNTTYTFGVNATDGTDIVNRSFNIVVNKVLDGSTSARANTSAQAIRDLGITTAGVYYITNSGSTIPVWCDFQGSEGYMLAISVNTANPETSDVWNTSSSSDVEVGASDTSPQDTDVVSQIRRNRVFQKIMIKYEYSAWSPTNLYYTTPVIYDNGSNVGSGLTALGTNTLINRASGNSGRLPASGCGNMSSEDTSKLRINATHNNARPTKLSNYGTNWDNQAGYFQIAGSSYNYGDNFEGGCNTGDTTKFELYIK